MVFSGRCSVAIDSPCECKHNNPDSLDARLFFTVVLAVAPPVTMDEASSLSLGRFETSPKPRRHLLARPLQQAE